MPKELACEKCGKTWRIVCPSELTVKVQSCQDCSSFKFHLVSAADGKVIPGGFKSSS